MTLGTTPCSSALAVLLAPDEHEPAAVRRARAHVATCPACALAFDDPSSADGVLARLDAERPARRPLTRAALTAVSVVQLVLAVPWLFGANLLDAVGGPVATSHLTRDGALGVLVGAAGLLCTVRPVHSRAVVLLCTVPILVQLISALADGAGSNVGVRLELVHLAAPIIVALVVLVGRPARSPRAGRRPAPLRSV